MAGNYIPQGSYKDIQVLSPTAVIDAMVLSAYTVPSHIFFEVYVPLDAFNAGGGDEYLSTTAAGLEDVNGGPNVQGVHVTSNLDSSGLVTDIAVVTVGVAPPMGASGPFTTEVEFPLSLLASDPAIYNAVVLPAIEAAVQRLQTATSASTVPSSSSGSSTVAT